MISVKDQAFISEQGRRNNNEDNCGYIPGNTYVVCDGVGGLDRGEVASDIVCRSVLNSFTEDKNISIEKALPIAELSMMKYLEENQNSQGMATTITLANIREDGVYLAWVGDSRIYQFRSGKIKFVTKDHSWVNEALEMGIITQEESINHPKSNIITRAVQGSHNKVDADSELITDIQANDYFLLCTDGVLEGWSDSELEDVFQNEESPSEILSKIKLKCEKLSRDNFTAIAFKINEANLQPTNSGLDDNYVEAIPMDDPEIIDNTSLTFRKRLQNLLKSKVLGIKVIFFVIIGFLLIIYWITTFFIKTDSGEFIKMPEKDDPPKDPKNEIPQQTDDLEQTSMVYFNKRKIFSNNIKI